MRRNQVREGGNDRAEGRAEVAGCMRRIGACLVSRPAVAGWREGENSACSDDRTPPCDKPFVLAYFEVCLIRYRRPTDKSDARTLMPQSLGATICSFAGPPQSAAAAVPRPRKRDHLQGTGPQLERD